MYNLPPGRIRRVMFSAISHGLCTCSKYRATNSKREMIRRQVADSRGQVRNDIDSFPCGQINTDILASAIELAEARSIAVVAAADLQHRSIAGRRLLPKEQEAD